jgi:hypothetical protein
MMKHWKNSSALIIALFSMVFVQAQNHRFEAEIPVVSTTDYYQIQLAPALLGTVYSNASDLRIQNNKGEEQAYFLTKESDKSIQKEFVAYPIVKQTLVPKGTSLLIFENKKKASISSINLLVNNADVAKKVRLSGSNDQQNWFVVKDQYFLQGFQGADTTTVLKMLRFPSSNYRYYQLSFDDSTSLPLHINAVGYYNTKLIKTRVTSFPLELKHTSDSIKNSYYLLSTQDSSYLERLSFYVGGSEYFDRNAKIRAEKKPIRKRKIKTAKYSTLAKFNLKSDAANEVKINGNNFKQVELIINNQDDMPLSIDSVIGSFNNRYAVVKLEAGEHYKIYWGDKKAIKPKYDLVKFVSKIKPKATIKHLEIISITAKKKSVEKNTIEWWQSTTIIWMVIGLVGLLLGYVAFKMINEMGAK